MKCTLVNGWDNGGNNVAIRDLRWFEILSQICSENRCHVIMLLTQFTVVVIVGELGDGEGRNDSRREP